MPEQQHDEKRLRQVAHDVQHCLHVIGVAAELLKTAREDPGHFAKLCESIDKECQSAKELVGELVDSALRGRHG